MSPDRTGPNDADATDAGRLWGGRFTTGPDEAAWRLGVSTAFDRALWRQDLAGSRAHAAELHRIGVLDADELARMLDALDRCAALFVRDAFPFLPTDEDVHGAIERWLVEDLGPLGGKLRAGRSRNDQIANDLRLWCRDACDELVSLVAALQAALADQAEAHLDWLAPGYTHVQRGQPVLLSHHLLAYVWMLDRDAGRLRDARERLDASVLGSGALAGTTLGLDPAAYAEHLGFARVTENSMDAVASRDFALEVLSACAILAVHLSRLGEEVVLWATSEFGFATVGDAFSTGSSIMPQKRNPDVAELVRGKAGRVVGALVSLLTTVKGLPMAYDRDLQEDKEPVFDAVGTLRLVLPAMTGTVASLTFDRQRLAAASVGGFALATDLAEELVRRGVPFREAHEVVGEVVRRAESHGVDLDGLDPRELAAAHPALDTEVAALLDPRRAVDRRDSSLGTATASVRAQLARAREAVAVNRSLG
ncbi:argininosuccinate lyase [Egicoccus halophilus]|uniref:Argininosuccinate lyase n=1 Tax=Egicoccus halophilus TaxID=1670830 RepID=A0A8J3ESI4_9ACTN|nr:argininosuccinate lyase [Egicoccus halophilus]GGI07510.1 argininosuccinate lyase [Egicoccus halophilus]